MSVTVILPMTENVRSSNYIRAHVQWWVELWDQGRFAALVHGTVNFRQGGRGGPGQGGFTVACEEHAVQAYNLTLLSGKIRRVVQKSTIW